MKTIQLNVNGNAGTFIPLIPEFNGKTGLQDTTLLLGNTPLDYFQLFFDDNMMQRILNETNLYYSQNLVDDRQHPSNWQDVISIEMYTFLAITMLTGIIRKNTINDY